MTIISKPVTKEYEEGWERVFGSSAEMPINPWLRADNPWFTDTLIGEDE